MATLREFEEALREQGMRQALRILERLRDRDRRAREAAAPRRTAARKMTPELAAEALALHRTTKMTQQEIAFALGVNQGRVNEVIKHGKWLQGDPRPAEAAARATRRPSRAPAEGAVAPRARKAARPAPQLSLF
jgi:hypothetical protein